MANYSGKDVGVIVIGGYDWRSFTDQPMTIHKEAALEDGTCFGDQDQSWRDVGLHKATWGHKGFFDDVALASAAAAAANFSVNVVGMVGIATNVLGKPVTMFKGEIEKTFDREVKVGSLTHVTADYAVTGEVDEGVIHQILGAIVANGNGVSIDGGAGNAPSAFGAAIVLEVTAFTLGTATNLIVKLQDSADNATFADVSGGAFTAVTAAPASQRLVIAGNIRRYTRVVVTWTGGAGGGSTATIVVGFYRGTASSVPS